MKNRHRFRQRLHRYAKMGTLPAYLHPFVDETGDLRPVPWEILEKARETRSGRGYLCSDAVWFGLRPDGPPPEPPQEEYKAGVVETSEEEGTLPTPGSDNETA